jgi:hypothetical protein
MLPISTVLVTTSDGFRPVELLVSHSAEEVIFKCEMEKAIVRKFDRSILILASGKPKTR